MKARSSQARELIANLRSLYALWRIDNDPTFSRRQYVPPPLRELIHSQVQRVNNRPFFDAEPEPKIQQIQYSFARS